VLTLRTARRIDKPQPVVGPTRPRPALRFLLDRYHTRLYLHRGGSKQPQI